MSISSIFSNTASTNVQNWQALMQQRQQGFQSLASSLQSGDLSGAQQAYSDLAAMASANNSDTSSVPQTSPAHKDFSALGQDLAAGNLTQAQNDFSQMKSVLAQNGGVHSHGHHGHKVEASSSTSDTSLFADPTLSSTTSSLLSQYGSQNPADSSMSASLLSLFG